MEGGFCPKIHFLFFFLALGKEEGISERCIFDDILSFGWVVVGCKKCILVKKADTLDRNIQLFLFLSLLILVILVLH